MVPPYWGTPKLPMAHSGVGALEVLRRHHLEAGTSRGGSPARRWNTAEQSRKIGFLTGREGCSCWNGEVALFLLRKEISVSFCRERVLYGPI
jgi:hypothetical protein